MHKIKLHGILNVDSKPLELSASTAREATEVLIYHLRRTKPELFNTGKLFFHIKGFDTEESLDAPLPDNSTLHFMPAFHAGKKAGFLQIAVGAVLVIGGAFLGVPPNISAGLITAGIGLSAGGILQFLTPVPRLDTSPEETNPEASKYISSGTNTTKVGTRIALGWGTFPVFGHFLSINTQSVDTASGPYSGSLYNSGFNTINSNSYSSNYTAGNLQGSIYAF